MAGFLYLGAGVGMSFVALGRKAIRVNGKEGRLTRRELPFAVAMILLDIVAPILLLMGLETATAENASLLNNFEIVATALIARVAFRERISPRLWLGILFVTLSCLFLSFEDLNGLRFSFGSLYILLACLCWGLENNCTRKISSKDPMAIVLLKGVFSGAGSLVIGFSIGEQINTLWAVFATMAVGLFAYGLSIFCYVYPQRLLGAARTSAYNAIAPFIGTLLSLAIFREIPEYNYYVGLFLMAVGAWLSSQDSPLLHRRTRKCTSTRTRFSSGRR